MDASVASNLFLIGIVWRTFLKELFGTVKIKIDLAVVIAAKSDEHLQVLQVLTRALIQRGR